MLPYFRIVGISLLSSIFIFLGRNRLAFDFLIEKNILSSEIPVAGTQSILFLLGIIWAGLILPFQYVSLKKKFEEKAKIFTELLSYNKEIHFKLISEQIQEFGKFNTRIFKPQRGLVGLWNKYVYNKVQLKMIYVDGISDDFVHAGLKFEVSKTEVQGMVGKSFKTKALCIDFDLRNNSYNLTDAQKLKIGKVEFCSTIPIFSRDQSKILAVVSVDSSKKLNFNGEQRTKWGDHMVYYAAFIDKHVKLK